LAPNAQPAAAPVQQDMSAVRHAVRSVAFALSRRLRRGARGGFAPRFRLPSTPVLDLGGWDGEHTLMAPKAPP
jgi:hypothetical protein